MLITKTIGDWIEDKFDELNVKDKFAYAKAFGLGAIDGYVVMSSFTWPILLIACVIAGRKLSALKD